MEINIKCTVNKVRFRNEETGFTILECENGESKLSFSAKGSMTMPVVDCDYVFTGEWNNNPKWGMEFLFKSYQQIMPSTKEGILKYLCSGYVSGIGKKHARLIVQRFGNDTINVLDNHIEWLKDIPGIGKKGSLLLRKAGMNTKIYEK